MNAFSYRSRQEALRRIGGEPFDILVIGCGIVGAGIARDAALRGLTVAAVDGGDLGGGTSSRTSRLVHGGLRYLEQFRIRLVSQAARERDRWVGLAPGLVEPIEFLIPADGPASIPRWKLRIGLAMYDLLSSRAALPKRRWIHGARAVEPLLRNGEHGAIYADARTDDARFVLEVARDAHDAGAAIATYAPVVSLRIDRERVVGAVLRDPWSNAPVEARAKVVVNATGPWLDRVRAMGGSWNERLRPTKGIHLVIPSTRAPVRSALALRSPDGRAFFIIPFGRYAIIGTTDSDHRGDLDDVAASPEDVDYLLRATNAAIRTDLSADDVRMTYASLRPLLASVAQKESDISRAHEVWEEPNGLVCVAGGKFTTHRIMARQVVARILRRLGVADAGDVTRSRPLRPRADPNLYSDLDLLPEERDRLRRRYPSGDIAGALHVPGAQEKILPDCMVLRGELDHALQRECVMTPSDFLVRRSGLLYEAADHGASALERVADRVAATVGWSFVERDRQVADYLRTVAAGLSFRG